MSLMICPGCNRAVSKYNSFCPYCNVSLDKSICCPKCKSQKVSEHDEKHRVLSFAHKKRKKRYACVECGNDFFVKEEEK